MKKIIFQKYSLVLIDLFSIAFTYWLAVNLANILEPSRAHYYDTDHLVILKLINAFILISVFWMSELYIKRRPIWEELRIIYQRIIFILVIDFAIIYVNNSEHITYFFFFMYWALLFVILPVVRNLFKQLLIHYNLWQRDLYIIGVEAIAEDAYLLLTNSGLMGYQVKAFVMINDFTANNVQIDEQKIPIITFNQLMTKAKHAEIAVALNSHQMVDNLEKIFEAQRHFLFVSIVPDFAKLPLYGIEVNHFFASEQLLLRLQNNLNKRLNRLIKATFDYLVVLIFLPILLPIFLIISLLIIMEDGRNPFFIQPRLGKHGKNFGCIKFRTMHKNAEKMLTDWQQENHPNYSKYVNNNFKLIDDPRVTKIGRFLRKTSLDELSQLVNVLKNQMSLVGPRPLLARELPEYPDGMFYYAMVKPGITGAWQVNGRSKTSFADRCRLDTWYIKNWSLWYDIVILLKTFKVVVKREGAL